MHTSRRTFLRALSTGVAVRFTAIGSLAVSGSAFDAEPIGDSSPQGPLLLNSNENAYGPSPKVLTALQGALGQANRYPYSHYEDLIDHMAALHNIAPERI